VTGGGDAGPTVVGAAVVDQHGGALLAMGILGAMVRKVQKGEGTRVETSLFAAAVDLQTEALTKYYALKGAKELLKRDRHVGSWYHDAPYGLYELADRRIVLSMNQYVRAAEALKDEAMLALTMVDHYGERDRCARATADALRHRKFADVAAAFDANGVWYEAVQDYDDLLQDPQACHNGFFRPVDVRGGAAILVNHPLRYDGSVPQLRMMRLEAGSDSLEILSELGYLPAERQRLVDTGVVGIPRPAEEERRDAGLVPT
jgi:crotonobetainyl-CoA:carnitine CoA-transferase CaiB-like acyl-CoA transferase